MRVLLIKTSSLGDVVHSLPALTDALRAYPDLQVDWVVEEAFADIARWHPAVKNAIPVAIRRWRQSPLQVRKDPLWQAFRAALKAAPYDLILDAQGLLKCAWTGLCARGPRAGFDRHSVREALSCLFYQRRYSVARNQHAVERTRQLFAQALAYELPTTMGDYGVLRARVTNEPVQKNSLMFLHGTTWASKHYPENYWSALAQKAVQQGYSVNLPWGNDSEKQRADRIVQACASAQVRCLPKMSLREVAVQLACTSAVIGVDSGLAHLACALGVPTVSLYGPTNPALTATYGPHQRALAAQFGCAPCMRKECNYHGTSVETPACFDSLAPERVWGELSGLMALSNAIVTA